MLGRRSLPPLIIAMICLALLVFGLVRLARLEKMMTVSVQANLVWMLSQAEVDTMRLDLSVRDSGVRSEASVQRYNVLLSRVAVFGEGNPRRLLDMAGMSDAIARDVGAVQAVMAGQQGDPAAVPDALSAALGHLRATLNRAGNHAMLAEWASESQRFSAFRNAIMQVLLSLAGALMAAAWLVWRVVRDQRAVLAAERAALHARGLEQQLAAERDTVAYWRDFAAVVSHQFRTPLAVIDSTAQRMVREGAGAGSVDLLARQARIRAQVALMTRLVDAALLVGRLENGLMAPDCRQAALAPVISDAVADLRNAFAGRDIAIANPQPGLRAWCDPPLCRHIIINLAENALKYSPADRPVRLVLRVDGARVGVCVVDHGPGIAPDFLHRMFDRNARDQQPGSRGEGSGLGLWIALRLAQLQGGNLQAANNPDGGATLTLWLRRTRPDPEPSVT